MFFDSKRPPSSSRVVSRFWDAVTPPTPSVSRRTIGKGKKYFEKSSNSFGLSVIDSRKEGRKRDVDTKNWCSILSLGGGGGGITDSKDGEVAR